MGLPHRSPLNRRHLPQTSPTPGLTFATRPSQTNMFPGPRRSMHNSLLCANTALRKNACSPPQAQLAPLHPSSLNPSPCNSDRHPNPPSPPSATVHQPPLTSYPPLPHPPPLPLLMTVGTSPAKRARHPGQQEMLLPLLPSLPQGLEHGW